MADKKPMQADGGGKDAAEATVTSRPDGPGQTGESGGGAYPNPHTGKKDSDSDTEGFMGHGGQTDIGYRGSDGGKSNSATDEN